MDTLLRPQEVAQRLGVTTNTLINWVDAGRLTAVRTDGGQRRYRAVEVELLADARRWRSIATAASARMASVAAERDTAREALRLLAAEHALTRSAS